MNATFMRSVPWDVLIAMARITPLPAKAGGDLGSVPVLDGLDG
jgi:hypothetical protein